MHLLEIYCVSQSSSTECSQSPIRSNTDGGANYEKPSVKPPLLILHGADDARVPPAQGLALHRALARRGLDTRLVQFPGAGHRIDDPVQMLSLTREVLAWFDRHL